MTFTETEGILLKRTAYGDSDLILYFLTAHGTETYFAQAARKSRKRFGGQLDFFRRLKLRAFQKGEGQWMRLEGCELIEVWEPLWQEAARYEVVCRWIALLRGLLPAGKGAGLYPFVCESLRVMAQADLSVERIAEYDLRFQLTLSRRLGYGPNFEACLGCRQVPEGRIYFNDAWGGVRCEACFAAAYTDEVTAMQVTPEVFQWLSLYQSSGKPATALSKAGALEVAHLLEAHWRQHELKGIA